MDHITETLDFLAKCSPEALKLVLAVGTNDTSHPATRAVAVIRERPQELAAAMVVRSREMEEAA
jgi:hypothetical protein